MTGLEIVREHPEFPALRVCSLLDVPRSSFYRAKAPPAQDVSERELGDRIEAVAAEFACYGSRRIARELQDQGVKAGRKLVQRLMRERSLLCRAKRRFVRTTDSGHGLRRYPNLAKGLKVARPNQVWHSDITYIRLPKGFCYLAAILDGYSRKAVGWSLSERIDAELALAALRMALASRKPLPGWIHHSDQGVQYASRDYVEACSTAHGRLSMSSKAFPYDNAKAESFFATLKKEEVYLEEYMSFEQARERIGHYIGQIYNERRLHSKLGYASPNQYEKMMEPAAA